jgi:hypothetical protein
MATKQLAQNEIRCLNWNGGLSHVMFLDGENIDIYHCLDQFDLDDKIVGEWLETIDENGVARELPPFLKEVIPSLSLNDVTKSEIYDGAALFHCKDDRFIFVEETIKEFHLLDGDSFVKFVSVVGNSGVPYSHIVGKKYNYILSFSSNSAFANELFNEHEDVYCTYYEKLLDNVEGLSFYFENMM